MTVTSRFVGSSISTENNGIAGAVRMNSTCEASLVSETGCLHSQRYPDSQSINATIPSGSLPASCTWRDKSNRPYAPPLLLFGNRHLRQGSQRFRCLKRQLDRIADFRPNGIGVIRHDRNVNDTRRSPVELHLRVIARARNRSTRIPCDILILIIELNETFRITCPASYMWRDMSNHPYVHRCCFRQWSPPAGLPTLPMSQTSARSHRRLSPKRDWRYSDSIDTS